MKTTEILFAYSLCKTLCKTMQKSVFWQKGKTVLPIKFCKFEWKGDNVFSLGSSLLKGQ